MIMAGVQPFNREELTKPNQGGTEFNCSGPDATRSATRPGATTKIYKKAQRSFLKQ
jgi:hypothetical protein